LIYNPHIGSKEKGNSKRLGDNEPRTEPGAILGDRRKGLTSHLLPNPLWRRKAKRGQAPRNGAGSTPA